MIIKEYQVKKIFQKAGVPILKGSVAYTPEEAQEIALQIGGNAWVIKAQVAGTDRSRSHFIEKEDENLTGICWANTPQMVGAITEQMLGQKLLRPNGLFAHEVRRVYVEEACFGQAAYRLSLRIDFLSQQLMLSVYSSDNTLRQYELPEYQLSSQKIKTVISHLHLKGNHAKEMQHLLNCLIHLLKTYQAVAIEFDPVWETNHGLVVLDGRIIFNEDALFRFPEISALIESEPGQERIDLARKYQFHYTKFNGNIACLVNGIGLGQATVDLIRQKGGQVACLLDIGTEPTRNSVAQALKLALSDPDVDGVLVNIFGGNTRCDIIVQGLLTTANEVLSGLPVVIRMDGTNANIGRRLLFESRLPFEVVKDMGDAVTSVIRQVKEASPC